MNDYLLSMTLGIVEGLTEFLPISSTAHLRVVQSLLNVSLTDGYWKMYTVVIQLGAILCLPVYFRERITKLVFSFPRGDRNDRNFVTHPLSLTLVAFICTAGPAFMLARIIGKHLESLYIMGASLLVGGIVMWVVDYVWGGSEDTPNPRVKTKRMDEMTLPQAVWIGLCQVLSAVFPGISRSMSTIAAGQVAGMSRSAALEFSFFLSMPTMAVATMYDLFKSLRGGDNPLGASHIDLHGWVVLAIGFVVSFAVAYGTVAWFMAWVRRRGFVPFAVYRIACGIAVLLWAGKF